MPLTNAERQQRYRARKRDARNAAASLHPREMRVITGIVEGKSTRQALKDAGFSNGHSGSMERRLKPGGDLAVVLGQLLEQEQVGMQRLIRHAGEKLQARRLFNAAGVRQGENGKIVKVTECIDAEDNDAQLRANELLIGLHERAGTIPAAVPQGGSVGALHYHLHLGSLADPRLIPAIDAAPDADSHGESS